MIKHITIGCAVIAFATITVTACGGDKTNEHNQDAPRDGRDNSGALVINMPDGFGNLATKCVGGVRYTVLFHNNSSYGSLATVVDPSCKAGAR